MYKMIATIKRKDGLSHEEFREHYESHHAPWGIPIIGTGLRRYVRNYRIVDEGVAFANEPDWDVVTEFWWNRKEDWFAFLEMRGAGGETARLITEDEESFMDIASIRIAAVEEIEELRPFTE